MTDLTPLPVPGARDDDTPADVRRIPPTLRILVGVGIVSLLVAVYAVVQAGAEDGSLPSHVIPDQPEGVGEAPKPGSRAPDIAVSTLDGGSFSLTEHLANDGRPVFVNMWAEWCFPCREEMPAIDAISKEHPEVHFIGVVVRDREGPARAFVDEYKISYQIGLDAEGVVEDDYLVWVMPTTYVIGSDGRIVDRFFGPMGHPQIEELIARAVDPAA